MELNIPKAALPTPTPGIHQHAENPTTTRISNLNCDSGRVVQRPPPPPPNALHSEDSNSSSNMVIDESCNTNHLLPPSSQPPAAAAETDTKPATSIHANPIIVEQPQAMNSQLEPDLPPDRPPPEMAEEDSAVKLVPPLRLVVPKFKLRVPKEFQKSVDDALSSSESEEAEDEEECGGEEDFDKSSDNPNDSTATIESNADANEQPTAIFNETTPANSQDRDIERNSATESATEAGNSQDDVTYESGRESKTPNRTLSQDDDDSLDEPNSNLVRIMQEIERTKKDIKRTKKTSFRNNNNNNNQNKQFAEPRQPTLSQCSIRTADHNWSPTPPASPNSRWFTPRRSTVSQSDDTLHQRLARSEESLLHLPTTSQSEAEDIPAPVVLSAPTSDLSVSPAKSHVTQERRDTIGSDMMDIDETITAQPTQTIYGYVIFWVFFRGGYRRNNSVVVLIKL